MRPSGRPTAAQLAQVLSKVKKDKKQLKNGYRQTQRPVGIFLVRNNQNDKVFLGSSLDLPSMLNRQKFQLEKGGHPNKLLQADWNEFGPKSFSFEIVDELSAREQSEAELRRELEFLEKLWLEKLQPFGDRGYNLPKLSRAEMLQRIARKSREE